MNDVIDRLTDALNDQSKAMAELKASLDEWQLFLEKMLDDQAT